MIKMSPRAKKTPRKSPKKAPKKVTPIPRLPPGQPIKTYPIWFSPLNFTRNYEYEYVQVIRNIGRITFRHTESGTGGVNIFLSLEFPPKIKIKEFVFCYQTTNAQCYIDHVILAIHDELGERTAELKREFDTNYSSPVLTDWRVTVDNVQPHGYGILELGTHFEGEGDIEITGVAAIVEDIEE